MRTITPWRLLGVRLPPRLLSVRPLVPRRFLEAASPPPINARVHPAIAEIEAKATSLLKSHVLPADHIGLTYGGRSPLPLVLVVGNHSSGKSTFINSLFGRDEQKTGVAPTDDGFTILTRSATAATIDGPALMSASEWGFGGLRAFGPTLVSHISLKLRPAAAHSRLPDGLLVVDSPGMINAPKLLGGAGTPAPGGVAASKDRGYDFIGAVRWLADRADLILLLFDPSNPGTTGETLDVLTAALAGHEHKFLVVLNKVDCFLTAHDFARAYGALCWNLAKVVPRKDLPRIYTMFVPTTGTGTVVTPASSMPAAAGSAHSAHSLAEFARTREEVVAQVYNAPVRRVDNVVTDLETSALRVLMAARLFSAMRAAHRHSSIAAVATTLAAFGLPAAIVAAAVAAGAPLGVTVGLGAASFGAGLGVWAWRRRAAAEAAKAALKALDKLYADEFFREIAADDADVAARWGFVQPRMREYFAQKRTATPPAISAKQIEALQTVIKVEVPKLRQLCAALKSNMELPPATPAPAAAAAAAATAGTPPPAGGAP